MKTSWLRQRREAVGIDTQDELAAKLQLEGVSITRAAVSHWENGRNDPPLKEPHFLRALARVLKVTETELLRIAGYPTENSLHSEQAERAAYIVDQLPEDRRELAVKLLEQLL
ncbi:MAG: helix-turn-helix transcriptional regulator [Chloroflexi bacterium]|uniref:helix-turn-helix domain-containing protein n=1 Tax=Candidatus Flexifilum breve TaxID=3140694 RepID=UPI003136AC59|nr:helix-turn-helix transcriptional regulator [Chloroflexota bacterium]